MSPALRTTLHMVGWVLLLAVWLPLMLIERTINLIKRITKSEENGSTGATFSTEDTISLPPTSLEKGWQEFFIGTHQTFEEAVEHGINNVLDKQIF